LYSQNAMIFFDNVDFAQISCFLDPPSFKFYIRNVPKT
jgi:hypothetical protein